MKGLRGAGEGRNDPGKRVPWFYLDFMVSTGDCEAGCIQAFTPGSVKACCSAEAHRQVERLHMFGQGADGNIVDAGIGEFADGVKVTLPETSSAAACGNFHRLAHQIGGEVIEHNDISPGF